MRRRAFLGTSIASLMASVARAVETHAHPVDPPPSLGFRTMTFEKTAMYNKGNTAIVAIPRDLPAGARLPLIVLLPGGEHTMQKREHGCWAWWSEFKLGPCDMALRRGKLGAEDFGNDATAERIAEVNASLASRPYGGAVIVTPWVLRRQTDLGPHGAMVIPFLRQLVERCRKELPVLPDRSSTGLGGVSAGATWVLYGGATCADLFGTLMAVQPYTDGYDKVLRKAMKERSHSQHVRIVSTTGDRLKTHNAKMVATFRADGHEVEHHEYRGQHEPKFVAGAGGIDTLFTFDRKLARASAVVAPAAPSVSAAPSASAPPPAPAPAAVPPRAPEGMLLPAPYYFGLAAVSLLAAGGVYLHGRRRRHDPSAPRDE